MKYKYKVARKIKYNNKIFQILIRDDNKIAFLRIDNKNGEYRYEYPTAQEFLHLSSFLNVSNGVKF